MLHAEVPAGLCSRLPLRAQPALPQPRPISVAERRRHSAHHQRQPPRLEVKDGVVYYELPRRHQLSPAKALVHVADAERYLGIQLHRKGCLRRRSTMMMCRRRRDAHTVAKEAEGLATRQGTVFGLDVGLGAQSRASVATHGGAPRERGSCPSRQTPAASAAAGICSPPPAQASPQRGRCTAGRCTRVESAPSRARERARGAATARPRRGQRSAPGTPHRKCVTSRRSAPARAAPCLRAFRCAARTARASALVATAGALTRLWRHSQRTTHLRTSCSQRSQPSTRGA